MGSVPPSQNPMFMDLYPERRGTKVILNNTDRIKGHGNRAAAITKCENQVLKCFEKVPFLKLMWNAIESQGCELNLSRHFSCDYCKLGADIQHMGTYDDSTNQVLLKSRQSYFRWAYNFF
jgi:hypothetical protein